MKALIFFADGLEECEGLLVVDIFRRAKLDIDICSIKDTRNILTSHQVSLTCDKSINEINENVYDIVILPGGMKGTANLVESIKVAKICKDFNENGKRIAAVCAGPWVLKKYGLLKGKHATVHPVKKDDMEGVLLEDYPVVIDGNITTSWGLGASIPFALTLISYFVSSDEVEHIKKGIVYKDTFEVKKY